MRQSLRKSPERGNPLQPLWLHGGRVSERRLCCCWFLEFCPHLSCFQSLHPLPELDWSPFSCCPGVESQVFTLLQPALGPHPQSIPTLLSMSMAVRELCPAEFFPAATNENKLSRTESCCRWGRGWRFPLAGNALSPSPRWLLLGMVCVGVYSIHA